MQWHSYGLAIDLNPLLNPYVRGNLVLPPEGRYWLDRRVCAPGMIEAGDPVWRAFIDRGWTWGGSWDTRQDYQHFEKAGSP
jgi:hypothetical protein